VMNKHRFIVAKGIADIDGKEMIWKPAIERRGIAVRTVSSVYKSPSIRNISLYKEGIVYAQSLPAALAVYNLAPEKGDTIVDLCAAPGGKITHATELTEGKCRFIAVEKKPRRMKKLRENLVRMGLNNIVTTCLEDARNFPQRFNVKADKVIVDPPCTGFGIRPSLFKETTLRDVEGLSTYSRQLIRAGSKLLKKGGRLLYSTCTLELEENELVVDFSVKELGLKLEEQQLFLGVEGESLENSDFNPSLVQRFYPDIHPYPGFFIAVFKR
jgi:16S rRNA C967 or C1407 C5-methylase (RsmB/RsmF family)